MTITLECDECGKEFEKYPSRVNDTYNFCSSECSGNFHGGPSVEYEELENEEWLREKYHNEGLTQPEIAKELGCSKSAVSKKMKEHGIEVRDPLLSNPNELRKMYHEEGMTQHDIADYVGCDQRLVWRKMKEYDIETRSSGRAKQELEGDLSKDAIAIIEGELLGDGHVTRSQGGETSAFQYATVKEDYRDWLANQFESWGFKLNRRTDKIVAGYGDEDKDSYSFRTHSYPCLYRIRQRWYPNGEKRIPSDLELTPLRLRHWYIGDGSYNPDKRTAKIAAYAFTADGLDRMYHQLEQAGMSPFLDYEGIIGVSNIQSLERFFEYMANLPTKLEDVYGYKWP